MSQATQTLEKKAADAKCNARKRKGGGYCGRPAGWGTDHLGTGRCKLHGGSVPNHRKNAKAILAREGVKAFGLPQNIEPHEALIGELCRTNGLITFYEEQIQSFENASDLAGPVGSEGTARDTDLEHHPKAEVNVFVRLYNEEREHLVKVAKTCIDAGIQERQVQIAEAQGALFATAIRGMLEKLGINLAAPQTRQVVRAALLEISQSSQEAIPTNGAELQHAK